MLSNLRDYQDRAITMLRQSIGRAYAEDRKPRPMMMAPTGAGKTIVGCAIIEMAREKSTRACFCAPAIELIDQTVDKLYREGIRDVGVIQANHPMTNFSRPVQVASVQTLQRRQHPDFGLVLVDEAHQAFKYIFQWMDRPGWERVPFIGMSATPWTKGLGNHYDDLIIVTTTEELIKQGYLSPFIVYAPSHPDLSKVRTVAGDYHEGDLAGVMGEDQLVADIVSTWKKLGQDRPTLAFAVDCAHARKIQADFMKAGVPCGYVDAFTDKKDREKIRKDFENGNLKVVANVGCLTTGVDWDVRCVILARPTKSEMLFVQMIGRGLRTAEGKDHCLILDHADNHLRLGMVTDIHYTELDRTKKGEKKKSEREYNPLPKECPKCHFVKPRGVHKCPSCGFAPVRQSEVDHREGELAEFTEKHAKASREQKQSFYSQLLTIADERGYKEGWTKHKFREKFGVWPQCLYPDRKRPSDAVRKWVQSRMIAYAKAKAKEDAA